MSSQIKDATAEELLRWLGTHVEAPLRSTERIAGWRSDIERLERLIATEESEAAAHAEGVAKGRARLAALLTAEMAERAIK